MKSVLALVVLFAGYAAAQSGTASAALPTGTSGISPCILQCSMQAAAAARCSSFADASCVCTSEAFQTAARTCLTTTCTPQEQQAALGLQSALCGSSSASATASSQSTATAPAASSASVSSRASASGESTSRVASATSARGSSVAASASSIIASISSAAASATGNAAAGLPVFNFAAGGVWAAVALGGVAAAQLVL